MAIINADHINPFLISATKVFREVCYIDVTVGKPCLREANFVGDHWVIIIGVTGEMKGQIMIAMTKEIACDIASKMCMMPVIEMDEMSSSAICELGNMIMGNASTVFSANGVGIDITPPTLSHGEMSFANNYSKNLCIPLNYDGEKVLELYLAIKS